MLYSAFFFLRSCSVRRR